MNLNSSNLDSSANILVKVDPAISNLSMCDDKRLGKNNDLHCRPTLWN